MSRAVRLRNITGLDRNSSSKSDKSAVPNRPTSAASTSVRSECTPVAANSLSNSDRSAVTNRSGFLPLQSVSWSLAEFRHNKIVQSPHENYFNVCRQHKEK